LIESIGHYVRDRIEYADQLIAESAMEKINPGDTVVTYARWDKALSRTFISSS